MGWIQLVVIIIQVVYEIIKMIRDKRIKSKTTLAKFRALRKELKEARRAKDTRRLKLILNRLIELKDEVS